jgi:aspartokinase-like uncharacterized kinase
MPFYVLKMGGSLMASARDLMRALCGLAEDGYGFLVVPGGGAMADLIRDLFSRYEISQEAAHWMSILAMEQYGLFLADGTGARITREIQRPRCGVEILLPYQALQKDDFGLMHSWDYTSDAVAALVAMRLNAPQIKATNVDGVLLAGGVVEEVSASSLLGKESCIDQGTLFLLRGRLKGRRVWVLNGSDPNRFVSALKIGKSGTIIKGE